MKTFLLLRCSLRLFCTQRPSSTSLFLNSFPFPKVVWNLFLLLLISGSSAYSQEVLVGLTSTGGPLNGGTAFSLKTSGASFSVSHKFMNVGVVPQGSLVKGTDGYFYGMTSQGETGYGGTIFKLSSTGALTLLHNLDQNTDGINPKGSLVQGSDGNFYGMTQSGGAKGYGTVFKISSSGIFTVLKTLDNTTGGFTYGSLAGGTDGNFYAITSSGGANRRGTIFKITPAGTLTVLRNINTSTDGSPYGDLMQGPDGYFYGMMYGGGATGYGTVFKISTTGAFTTIKNLDGGTTGGNPYGSLVVGGDGNLYGMTHSGGISYGGTIFKVTPSGTLTVLHAFNASTDGSNPHGSLVKGADGNFYGMASNSGTQSNGNPGQGTIFKITPSGTFTLLTTFDGVTMGGNPTGGLIEGTDGTFYGMTPTVNGNAYGTIFKITSTGNFSLLFRLPDNGQGIAPAKNLIQAKDGNYYGMASGGGTYNGGAIYKLCTSGSFTSLHSFDNAANGSTPYGSLVQGSDGYFYGMTYSGGVNGQGIVFRISSSGSFTVLKNFDGTNTGGSPRGSLVEGISGTFYGMTSGGGTTGAGTIFKINGTTLTVLRTLNGSIDGSTPKGSLVKGSDGNFYGTTTSGGANGRGTIFKMTPTGTFSVVHNLDNSASYAYGDLLQGADGNFYAMTQSGGTAGYGTIFKMTPAGVFTVLKSFDYYTTGGYPKGNLVQGSDGTLYGMAYTGGTYKGGTIFKIKPDGSSFAVLRQLNPATDGGTPLGSLVIQNASPVAYPQSVTLVQNTTKKIILVTTGSTPRTNTIAVMPLHGTATLLKDTITYTPAANYVGKDSLYFYTTWGCQPSNSAKVLISVTATARAMQVTGEAIAAESFGKLSVKAVPNPFSGSFTLVTRSGSNLPIMVRIKDATGRLIEVRSNVTSNSTLQLGSTYKGGFYYAEVVQGNERVTLKLIKGSD